MEIGRFIHDGINYEVGYDLHNFKGHKIPDPYILVTKKSSRKRRGEKLTDTYDEHFMRIEVKNPIGFYKKVYKLFEDEFAKFNYVSFTAYKDDQEKRLRVYLKGLEKMGFKPMYSFHHPWDKKYIQHIVAREGYFIKKKECNRIFNSWFEELEA